MIREPSAQFKSTYSVGLKTLPDLNVTFLIKSKLNNSTSLVYLSENDETFEVVGEGKISSCTVSRLLNSIQVFTLMSFIQPLHRKIDVLINDQTFSFNSFRGVMYAYCSNPSSLWGTDMGSGFHSNSQEDIENAECTFNFLQKARIDQ